MNSRKQAWIWAGLALTAGVGIVLAASSAPRAQPLPGNNQTPTPLPPGPQEPPAKPKPRVRAGDRILLIGDSLAVGLSASMRKLCQDAQVQFAAMAKEGTNITQWSAREYPDADVVLVSLGTNDMKMSDPLSERPKLDLLLQKLKATSKRVVWIAPPPMPFPDRGVRAMLAEATSAAGIEVFPSVDVPRGPDKIHPTAAGYAGWAGIIWRWIQ